MIVSTEAIVIRARKYGDSSKLVSFYTLEDGLITCIAKGSRLPKNKFGSSLEPLTLSFISFYKKSTTDLYLLSKSETVESHSKLSKDIDKINIGLAILEALTITQIQHDENSDIFNLMKDCLSELNEANHNFYNFFLKYLLELFGIIGFSLNLSLLNYKDTDEAGRTKYLFDIESGEIINNANGSLTFTLSKKAADYLKVVNDTNLKLLKELIVPDEVIKTINAFVSMYLSYHLDKKIYFKTLNIF